MCHIMIETAPQFICLETGVHHNHKVRKHCKSVTKDGRQDDESQIYTCRTLWENFFFVERPQVTINLFKTDKKG